MNEQKEIEKLQAKRIELEAESHSLKEIQKTLEDNIVILEEQIAIEELNANNNAVQQAIAQLEAKKNDLANKLKQVAQVPEAPAPAKQTMSEANAEQTMETPKSAETASEESEEEEVTVTAIDGEALVEQREELGENLKKQQEKKKHRLF